MCKQKLKMVNLKASSLCAKRFPLRTIFLPHMVHCVDPKWRNILPSSINLKIGTGKFQAILHRSNNLKLFICFVYLLRFLWCYVEENGTAIKTRLKTQKSLLLNDVPANFIPIKFFEIYRELFSYKIYYWIVFYLLFIKCVVIAEVYLKG